METDVVGIENTKESNAKVSVEKKSIAREWIEAILIALILALIIRTFVVQAFKIPSGSMLETLQIGDHILVNKFIYRFNNIERGDIIVFKYPKDESRDFIKRTIGLPGDKLEIKQRQIYINNHPISESYTIHDDISGQFFFPRDNFGPVLVPKDKVFVMGDNRENSMDSRFWGFLDISKVKGRAFIIYWSWNNEAFNVRWNRLGKLIK
jgi:signal peptidase I